MSFRARKLRVQLPCAGNDSLVEEAAGDDPGEQWHPCILIDTILPCAPGTGMAGPHCPQSYVSGTQPHCAGGVITYDCAASPPLTPCRDFLNSQVPCGHFESIGGPCELNVSAPPQCGSDTCVEGLGSPVVVAADEAGEIRTTVDADYLPILRQRLETRLAEIEHAARTARDRITGQLSHIARAEQAVQDREQQSPDAADDA